MFEATVEWNGSRLFKQRNSCSNHGINVLFEHVYLLENPRDRPPLDCMTLQSRPGISILSRLLTTSMSIRIFWNDVIV